MMNFKNKVHVYFFYYQLNTFLKNVMKTEKYDKKGWGGNHL